MESSFTDDFLEAQKLGNSDWISLRRGLGMVRGGGGGLACRHGLVEGGGGATVLPTLEHRTIGRGNQMTAFNC